MNRLAETAFHPWHTAHHGRLVDFAGWSMPVHYTSIVEEHQVTRSSAGVFDISHMGRLEFHGPDAAAWLSHLLTRRLDTLKPGQIRYALVTNEQGGVLDDVLVYRLPPAGGGHGGTPGRDGVEWMLVVNAGNRPKIVEWFQRHQGSLDSRLHDRTRDTAMIAVQGPRAIDVVSELSLVEDDAPPLAATGYYQGRYVSWEGQTIWFSRTGYTGEDGCELIVPNSHALPFWEAIFEAGESRGIEVKPAGLGARDTLRLEAAMPLYGHELDETVNPYEAGLGFAVHLKKEEFLGKDALSQLRNDVRRRRIGLFVDGKRIPRQHYQLFHQDQKVGEITSGSFSPTLQRPLAMAFVDSEHAETGTELQVDIRGTRVSAQIVDLPFYSRP